MHQPNPIRLIRLEFKGPRLLPLDEEIQVSHLAMLKEHDLLHAFYMEATLESGTRSQSIQINALEFTRDLLDGSIFIGRQAPFVVRLADDIAINCSPLRQGGADWAVELLEQSYLGSAESLVLKLFSFYASLAVACSSNGIDFEAICGVCSGYLGQR